MSDIVLYSYWRSSCSYRVRIVLELKGLTFDYHAVHLVRDGGEQHKEAYRAVNPSGQVPALVHQGQTLTQSVAIVEYLEAVFPEPRLYPRDPFEAARARQLCEMINAGIQPLQNLAVLQSLEQRFDCDAAEKAAWSRHWMAPVFAALERTLEQVAGVFSLGDEPSVVDAFLIPQIYNARRFELDMSPYPLLTRIDEACRGLAAFSRAEPAAQPDAP